MVWYGADVLDDERINCVIRGFGIGAYRFARLHLQIEREEHDARGRIRAERNFGGGIEWFASPRD
jgi:hypothetical protein